MALGAFYPYSRNHNGKGSKVGAFPRWLPPRALLGFGFCFFFLLFPTFFPCFLRHFTLLPHVCAVFRCKKIKKNPAPVRRKPLFFVFPASTERTHPPTRLKLVFFKFFFHVDCFLFQRPRAPETESSDFCGCTRKTDRNYPLIIHRFPRKRIKGAVEWGSRVSTIPPRCPPKIRRFWVCFFFFLLEE